MLSVVVLVHNRIEMSVRCLDALADATAGLTPCDVVCVDNASRDDVTPLRAAEARFARFRLVSNADNLSFADANNRAAALAAGRRLLFLNNDVLLDAATVSALLDALAEPAVGIVGCRLLFPGRQRVQHAGLVPTLWGYVSNYGVGAAATDRRFATPCDRPAVSGAVLGIDRALFTGVGGFDEGFRWGYEDVDLCFRVRALGRAVRYVGAGESEHVESATLGARREPADLAHNYAAYRARWNDWLAPREAAYLDGLRRQHVRRVLIFGDGLAARGLAEALEHGQIETAAFLTSRTGPHGDLLGRPVVHLDAAASLDFDRVMAGSQFFFEVEDRLTALDPQGHPLFPALAD